MELETAERSVFNKKDQRRYSSRDTAAFRPFAEKHGRQAGCPIPLLPLRGQSVGLSQTFGGSFSAVWTATIARVGAFFSIFRDLQDVHSFAPLQIQKFSKILSKICMILIQNGQRLFFFAKIVVFRTDFDDCLPENNSRNTNSNYFKKFCYSNTDSDFRIFGHVKHILLKLGMF